MSKPPSATEFQPYRGKDVTDARLFRSQLELALGERGQVLEHRRRAGRHQRCHRSAGSGLFQRARAGSGVVPGLVLPQVLTADG